MSDKTRSEHFLLQIDRLIDWGSLIASVQSDGKAALADLSPVVLKMLLLARWYGLNEAALLDAYRDRISFRRFLGLSPADNDGDDALDEAFRQHYSQARLESQKLILEIEAQLLAKGVSVKPGTWAEAVVVPVAVPSAADREGATEAPVRKIEGETETGNGTAARNSTADAALQESMAETIIARPGEVVEPRVRGQSLLVRSASILAADNLSDNTDSVVQSPAGAEAAFVQASIAWPWGVTTRLGEHLIVGREQRVCPYAAKLASDLHLSRKHAELTACSMGIWVRDLHSRNGTFVNDERIVKGNAVLVEFDAKIRFGPHCTVQLTIDS
ncbi:MAG: FHA domain-containing protein [Betaproteobacteria bacterium]|nr:FHA domain-containing protein [Betaproteobacteria bacterium]